MRIVLLAVLAALTMGAAPASTIATSAAPQATQPEARRAATPEMIANIEERIDRIEAREAAARQEVREVADLKAQEEMAVYGRRQFWLSLAGTLVALVSVAFTFTALWQTRASLALARKNSHTELRAYLGIKDFSPGDFTDGKAKETLLRWGVENFGNTPAVNVRVNLQTFVVRQQVKQFDVTEVPDKEWRETLDIPPRGCTGWYVPTDQYRQSDREAVAQGRACLVACFVIVYEDVFGHQHTLVHSDIRHGPKLATGRFNLGFVPDINRRT